MIAGAAEHIQQEDGDKASCEVSVYRLAWLDVSEWPWPADLGRLRRRRRDEGIDRPPRQADQAEHNHYAKPADDVRVHGVSLSLKPDD